MVIVPVDDGDVDGCIAQRSRGVQAAETGSNDHDLWQRRAAGRLLKSSRTVMFGVGFHRARLFLKRQFDG